MMNDSDRLEFTFNELARAARRHVTVSRIAIADDDPDSLELLRLALGNPLIEICEATNGAELVDLLAEGSPFDLVVADVLMPWMEGLSVLRSARAAKIDTPVLVVSGLTRTDLQAEVDGLGNAKFLRKPFGIPELRAAVVDLLACQRLM